MGHSQSLEEPVDKSIELAADFNSEEPVDKIIELAVDINTEEPVEKKLMKNWLQLWKPVYQNHRISNWFQR